MREKVVVICPTRQAKIPATDWHDGQFAHGEYAGIAGRATEHNPPFDLRRERVRWRQRGGPHKACTRLGL